LNRNAVSPYDARMIFRSKLAWLVLAASIGGNAFLVWHATRPERRAEVQLASPDQVEVIRTQGGLLEVSTIRSPETFQASTDHEFLAVDLGRTTTQIRVPATFHYHIELAPEWRVSMRGDGVLVVAPPVKPTLPVAIDTARLEKFASGTWSLFTGPGELDVLERSITRTLAIKAATPSYLQFQREAARLTVQEFVAKWLLTQDRYRTLPRGSVHVFFADEPISAMGRVSPVFGAAS
jgi:hypothetical protein